MDTGSGQYLLAKKSIFYIACATAFATLVRPIFADQSILFTYIGVLNSLLSFTLYFYVKQRPNSLHHGYLITLYIFISLVPLLVISGGVNSQYSVIFPIIPIFICLLIHNTKAAWAACAFLSTFVVILLLMESSLPNYTEETVSKQKSNARAFWIVISTFMATLFSVEFNRISHIFNNKLNEQANIDSLTQVANRRSILVTLNTLSKRAKHGRQSYSVMMLDIDYFKKVNDEFGHLIGDKALIHIANLLKSSLRSKEDSVGRYGGEEFLILLSNVNHDQTDRIANEMLDILRNTPLELEGNYITLTATIGYSCSLEQNAMTFHELAPDELLHRADTALYKGKKAGRNRVVYFSPDNYE